MLTEGVDGDMDGDGEAGVGMLMLRWPQEKRALDEAISDFLSCFPPLVRCLCLPWLEDFGLSEWVFDGFLYLRYHVLALM